LSQQNHEFDPEKITKPPSKAAGHHNMLSFGGPNSKTDFKFSANKSKSPKSRITHSSRKKNSKNGFNDDLLESGFRPEATTGFSDMDSKRKDRFDFNNKSGFTSRNPSNKGSKRGSREDIFSKLDRETNEEDDFFSKNRQSRPKRPTYNTS
jgi:hypothetical protein